MTEFVLALETKLARFQGERYRVVSPGHGAPRQDHGRLQTWRIPLVYPLKSQTNRYWCSIREKNEEYSEEIVFRNQYETSKKMFLEHSNIRAFERININDTFERCCETDFFIVLIRITKRESDS